ncbi:hypothetical protein [Vibrio sp. RC586]|uniref:hypothetical protein n=1 Tax=Vibrio sp. RC586 TaxID=675815 RepID=UPI0005118BFA|nr:hypothetical protein [Vibrio sp. RC586]
MNYFVDIDSLCYAPRDSRKKSEYCSSCIKLKEINREFSSRFIGGSDGFIYSLDTRERVSKNVVLLLCLFSQNPTGRPISYEKISHYIWKELKSKNNITQVVFQTNLTVNNFGYQIVNIRNNGYMLVKETKKCAS